MNIVAILAILFAAVVLIKVVMTIFGQKQCYRICKNLMEHEVAMTVISILVLLLVGYFLFQELSPLEVAAAAVFVFLLEAVTLFTHSHYEEIKEFKKKVLMSKNLARRNWFALFLWALFALWVILRLVV
jgi:hypothetical protein